MDTNETLRRLQDGLGEARDQGRSIDLCVQALCRLFTVTPHEVALLSLEKYLGMDALRFLWPPKLSELASGHVLLSSEQALAAKTFRSARAGLDNNFTRTPHTAIFEILAADDVHPWPIQKIISVPMQEKTGFQGVVQICRKGTDDACSAPDFTQEDLAILTSAASVISRHMKRRGSRMPPLLKGA